MRWVTFRRGTEQADRVGVIVESTVHALPEGATLLGLLGDDGGDLVAAGEQALRDPADVVSLNDITMRAPIPDPPTVRDFYAFEQHVKTARKRRGLEMDPDWYELPVFYFSNPYAVNGDGADVAVPPGSAELDFELEVAAIIGRGGSDLTPEQGEAEHRWLLRHERLERTRHPAARDEAEHGSREGQGLRHHAGTGAGHP